MGEWLMYNIGLTYNLRKGVNNAVEDEEAELDDWQTVEDIKKAIESLGCNVILLEATGDIIYEIPKYKIDIVFNFAEGLKGRGREAQIPALLNLLKIPFTGSDETTLGVALDKALAKKIVSYSGIKTPKFQLFFSPNEKLKKTLKFPLIVKPNAEGSSKGISDTAIAENEKELKELIERNIKNYNQSALVEEFIKGREFTIGLIGNRDSLEILPIMEIIFKNTPTKYNFYSYKVKKESSKFIKYVCPAKLLPQEERKIKRFGQRIFNALQCQDVARIDLRLSEEDNEPYFLEINPLPGLVKGYSDLPLIAESIGISYEELIKKILNAALKRYNMKEIC
jgi:D-alanine-D-alanine ligase